MVNLLKNKIHIAAFVQEMATQREKTKRVGYLYFAQVKSPHISIIIDVFWNVLYAKL